MMNPVDTLMVVLFPFIDALPYTLPWYWLARDRLRIPFRYTVPVQLAAAAVFSGIFYGINLAGPAAAAQWTTVMRFCSLLFYVVLAFLLTKDSFPMLMFTWLLFFSWQLFVFGNGNFIQSRFFQELSAQHPYLVYNIARMGVYLISCPFLFHFFRHTVAGARKMDDPKMWRHFWKIPLFSILFGLIQFTVLDVYAAVTWRFLATCYLMLISACYISHVVLNVLETSRARTQLEESLRYADRNLLAQKKQFDALAAHMDETRKARHDLRQHLAVVKSYLEHDDKAGLAEYIELYQSQLPPDTWERYCRNDVVNAVVCYYAASARDSGIVFEAGIDYPEGCPVSSTDITVLLGNLLENAVEACKREAAGGPQTIKFRVKQRGSSTLLILVDNPCLTPVPFDGDTPLSSKREGVGIGAASVREIAARYGGTVQFEQKGGVFYASVLLKLVPDGTGETAPAGAGAFPLKQ